MLPNDAWRSLLTCNCSCSVSRSWWLFYCDMWLSISKVRLDRFAFEWYPVTLLWLATSTANMAAYMEEWTQRMAFPLRICFIHQIVICNWYYSTTKESVTHLYDLDLSEGKNSCGLRILECLVYLHRSVAVSNGNTTSSTSRCIVFRRLSGLGLLWT
jgi:hypothetical protein